VLLCATHKDINLYAGETIFVIPDYITLTIGFGGTDNASALILQPVSSRT